MTNPLITVNDGTGAIDRPMNAGEFTEYNAIQADNLLQAEQADATATQKAALLARLGITADEAKLLIG